MWTVVSQGYMGKVLMCGFYNVFLGYFWCNCVPRIGIGIGIGIGIAIECDGICKLACQGYWRPMEGKEKTLVVAFLQQLPAQIEWKKGIEKLRKWR